MNIENLLNTYSLYLLVFGTVSLALLAAYSLRATKIIDENKKLIFITIVMVTLIPTLVMAGSTVYINVTSSSSGPVHWHTDFEIYKCGKEVNIRDPKGLSNKIGTSTFHEHSDKRIHLEGVVMNRSDASLGNFFNVIGGELSPNSFTIPVNEGFLMAKNGDGCLESGAGEVQVFVFTTDKENYYSQKKLSNPQNYIISPESNVPSGDCVIIEFDTPKDRTDKMCRSYKVAEKIGKLKGDKK
ncbi:MAG TPA: hypothetical protein VM077_01225 [Candidatus Limnocylindrales bacterium]|nr:hypothetical protein [Candidatus Limnocylindrales bacterium]